MRGLHIAEGHSSLVLQATRANRTPRMRAARLPASKVVNYTDLAMTEAGAGSPLAVPFPQLPYRSDRIVQCPRCESKAPRSVEHAAITDRISVRMNQAIACG